MRTSGAMRRRTAAWATAALAAVATSGAAPAGEEAPPPLAISADYPGGSTGTMHYAERVTLRRRGAKPLVLTRRTSLEGTSTPAFGDMVPIPGLQLALGDDAFLLLGWTSVGAGMQTSHAMRLVVRDGRLVLAGHLQIQTDRPSAGLMVRPSRPGLVELGFPEPVGFLHSQEDWYLVLGGERLELDDMRRMLYADYAPLPEDRFYSPPFQRPFARGRVAWITVKADRFELPFERLPAPP